MCVLLEKKALKKKRGGSLKRADSNLLIQDVNQNLQQTEPHFDWM